MREEGAGGVGSVLIHPSSFILHPLEGGGMSGDRRIDWDDVRRRLRATEQALEQALNPGPERIAEVYRRRADDLAGRRGQDGRAAAGPRVLAFALGAERFALELTDVVELLAFGSCTPVPGGPAQLLGVMNVHGEIRSVLDL